MDAVAVLRDAGLAADPAAPASAAHWFAAALRLLPGEAPDETRLGLLLLHARRAPQTASSPPREALLEALRLAPPASRCARAA